MCRGRRILVCVGSRSGAASRPPAVTPGWQMAAEITASLRRLDPADPVRYDFALCHLGMMGGCGFRTRHGDSQCPLRGCCRPRQKAKAKVKRQKL